MTALPILPADQKGWQAFSYLQFLCITIRPNMQIHILEYHEPQRMTLRDWLDIWYKEYCVHIKASSMDNYDKQIRLYTEIITEREHGDAKVKPHLDLLLETAEEGSTLICCEVSRLSRSTQQLCEIVNIIKEKHMRLIILGSITVDCRSGQIDPMSQAFIQMSAVFAELELSILRARVRSGLANAVEKGRKLGRPQTTKDDIPAIFYKHYPAYVAGNMNISELSRICNLSRPTVYKYLKLIA